MIQYIIAVPPDALAHLREVDADGVGFVLPGYVDLWLRATASPLNFCTARQSERRLLGDQLQKYNKLVKKHVDRWEQMRFLFVCFGNIIFTHGLKVEPNIQIIWMSFILEAQTKISQQLIKKKKKVISKNVFIFLMMGLMRRQHFTHGHTLILIQ